MNGGGNAFGSGNRANATIGRAIRLVLLNVGGGWPGDLDKSTLGHPGKYTYCVAENEEDSPWAPYHVEKGFAPEDSTVFVIAAEPPHSVTNHVANDPEGILDSICSAMSTIANNNAVSSGHCAVVIGPEHARTIAGKGWTRHDVRNYLHMNAYNLFRELAFDHRYGQIYNRNLPQWYKREPDSRIPIVPSPDHIHLFVIGGAAGRFSAFIPGWGHMTAPVLRSIEGTGSNAGAGLRRRDVLSCRALAARQRVPNRYDVAIGRRLEDDGERRSHWSLEDLAKACAGATITSSQISKLERGMQQFTAQWIYRFADALNCYPTD